MTLAISGQFLFLLVYVFTAWLHSASYLHNFNDPFWYPLWHIGLVFVD